MAKLADAFRKIRDAWFVSELRDEAHERVWEDKGHEAVREEQNLELKYRFDAHTERIIAGEDLPICPRCEADMDVG